MSTRFLYVGLLLILFLSLTIYSSCVYDFVEPEKVVLPEVISFSDDIIPIFNNSCNTSGCHAAGFGILDLSPENAYEDLFRKGQIDVDNPANSSLYSKLVESGGTHEGRSTAAERATILEWINKGAQNN